jgi:hypothetical protein
MLGDAPANAWQYSRCLRFWPHGLELLISARDKPKTIISDNGTELTGNAIPPWMAEAS